MADLSELRGDRTELKELLEQAKRPRVRVVLQNELSSVDAKIHEIERQRLQDDVATMGHEDKENPSLPGGFESRQKTTREGRIQRSKITSYDCTLRNSTNNNSSSNNSNKEGRFPCQATGCSYVCRWQCEMKVHMNKHTKERPYVCDWANCGKSFGDKSSMRTHYNAVHLKLKKFKCHVKGCSLSFTCAKSRNRHSRNTKLHEKLFSGQCFRDQYMCVNHTTVAKEEKPTKQERPEDMKSVEESHFEKEQVPSPTTDFESKFYLESPKLTNPMGLMFLNHPSMYPRGDYYLYKDLFSKALMKEYSMYGYGLSGAGYPGFYLPAPRASVIKENNLGKLSPLSI